MQWSIEISFHTHAHTYILFALLCIEQSFGSGVFGCWNFVRSVPPVYLYDKVEKFACGMFHPSGLHRTKFVAHAHDRWVLGIVEISLFLSTEFL